MRCEACKLKRGQWLVHHLYCQAVFEFFDRTGSHALRKCPVKKGLQSCGGSVTKRFLGIPVQSTYECKTRGEGKWHCPPRGKADAHTRKPCHAPMSSRAPSKPCVIAPFLFRFQPKTFIISLNRSPSIE